MSSYLDTLEQKLKDKRYWRKDRYSDYFMLTDEGKEIQFQIEEEKRKLKELKESDPVYREKRIKRGCKKLLKALTDKDVPAETTTSLTTVIDDYIRPTRDYRKFIYELDEHERAGLYNWSIYTEADITDMREMLEEANKK